MVIKTLLRDLQRHRASASQRSMLALTTYRLGRWVRDKPLPVRWVGGKLYGAALLASETLSGIFLDRDTDVGADVHFVHAGGINIHPRARIGDRVGMMHGVTLGAGPDGDAPTIGDDVFIGANATVLGGVSVGDGASIAANSLVLCDVPEGALAIGVPAKIVKPLKASEAKAKTDPREARRGRPQAA